MVSTPTVSVRIVRVCAIVGLFTSFAVFAGCEDEEPVELDLCGNVDCEEGQFCDNETGECRCDEFSCGEGRSCEDETTCVEDAAAECESGTEWVDQEGCLCDQESCEVEGGTCTEDETGCVLGGSGAECSGGSGPWGGEQEVFAERSEEAGIAEMEVQGGRLATGDVTGDGYPDLFVRQGLAGADDFSEEGDRESWLLENQGDATFEDITQSSGLVQRRYDDEENRGRPAEVIAFADVDNDGTTDVVTLATDSEGQSEEGAEVMLNDGEGNFELGPVSDGFHAGGEVVANSGASFTDVDRDGNIDLWVGRAGGLRQDRLFVGDGTGSFSEANEQFGVQTEGVTTSTEELNEALGHSFAWSVAACNLDGDPEREMLAASYGRRPNHLWDAAVGDDGQVMFENRSLDSGYAFDDRQDWTDNESARCWCQHNPDDEGCEGVPEPAHIQCNSQEDGFRWNHATDREPYRLGGNSGTTVCGDLDNDGNLDLLTTEIRHWDVGSSSDPTEILYNTGETPPRFERPGNEATGLARSRDGIIWDDGDMTAAVFDFDNDGRLDILVGSADYPRTRARLYHQKQDGTFELVPVDLGIDLTSAHGMAVADYDRDGALDVVVGHSKTRCNSGDHCLEQPHVRFFENQFGADNNWIQLHLEGAEGTNRSAIGARVTVVTDELIQTSEVDGGHGHYGIQHELVQHFGLAGTCQPKVIIDWPDSDQTREIYRLSANQRYHIRQGETPQVVP